MKKFLTHGTLMLIMLGLLSVSALAGSPTENMRGLYVGKATFVYYDLVTAKAKKFKGVVSVEVASNGTVFLEVPSSPENPAIKYLELTGNFGPDSGIALDGSSSTSVSVGFTFKGVGDKTTMSLGGSVTHDTSENFTMVITGKKLKKSFLVN